jgi:hypothetical protein
MHNSKKLIALVSVTFFVFASCRSNNNTKDADKLPPKDSCLYKSILNSAKQSNLKISECRMEDEPDSNEVLSSLRNIYYDTVMNAFSQTTKISVVGDSINRFVFSEYLFDSVYYHVIKTKKGGLWAIRKIEGPFMFTNDTGIVRYPGVFILKGPPNILIARNFDTSFNEYQRKFLLSLIPLINNCRGTDHW